MTIQHYMLWFPSADSTQDVVEQGIIYTAILRPYVSTPLRFFSQFSTSELRGNICRLETASRN